MTIPSLGSPCTAHKAVGLSTCKVLNNAQLTSDGITAASEYDLSLPDSFQNAIVKIARDNSSLLNATIFASDECRAAYFAFNCLYIAGPFHYTDGIQIDLPCCFSVCTAVAAACYPKLLQHSAYSACASDLVLPTSQARCANISGGIVVNGSNPSASTTSTAVRSTSAIDAISTPAPTPASAPLPAPPPAAPAGSNPAPRTVPRLLLAMAAAAAAAVAAPMALSES